MFLIASLTPKNTRYFKLSIALLPVGDKSYASKSTEKIFRGIPLETHIRDEYPTVLRS